MTSEEKKLLQAKHRLEEAQARDRVKERKARTRRLIQEGAVLEKVLPEVQAVVALPLVGHVRSPRGIAAPVGAAGQGCISTKLPALPMQSAQGFPLWNPLFMGWYIATPSRRLAREFVVALPIELSKAQWERLLSDFVSDTFVSDGMCADVAIHDPYPPGHNPHAHILLTVRPLDEKGKWQYKTEKEYLCVKDGEERGLTAAEFKQAQADGWGNSTSTKWAKRRYIWPRPQRRPRIMNGHPSIPKAPNSEGRTQSQNAGTATSSLSCGGCMGGCGKPLSGAHRARRTHRPPQPCRMWSAGATYGP